GEPEPGGALHLDRLGLARSLSGGSAADGMISRTGMRKSARSGTCDRRLTAAKTIVSYRHGPTSLEYRPSSQLLLDRSGRSAHAYGSAGRRGGTPGPGAGQRSTCAATR